MSIKSSLRSSRLNSNEFESPTTLQKLKERDSELLTRVFSELNPRLFRMLASHGLYKEIAEEIVHECWETFFVNLDQYEGRSQINTFIYGILINKIREYRRKINKIQYEEDSEKVLEQCFAQGGWWSQEQIDAQKIIENQQLGEAIEACLEGLTDSQKTAFVLMEVEGESAEAASSVLGVSLTNLRVLLFRAKNKLRACLEGQIV